jgi:Tol biopolymer transport system component
VPPPQIRQITVRDREGKVVSTIGPPGFIGGPGISPDGKRVVVIRNDPQTGNADIWTYDIANGNGTPITNDIALDNSPIWSADGAQIVYASFRKNFGEVYRTPSDGTGTEELLFRYTECAGIGLTDWSADGKFLTFSTGALLVIPLRADQPALDRKPLDWLREDYDAIQGRFSPDGRFLAYMSNELDVERMQVYVRPFDASKPEGPAGPAVQISQNGSIGGVSWRQDGKEMYFMTGDWEVMALDITARPTFNAGTPKILFKLPGPVPGNPGQKFVSSDGQRFVFVMPAK